MQLVNLIGLAFLLPESFSLLTGPKSVHAVLGKSVSVPCQYDPSYKGNEKYWCKIGERGICNKLVQTLGSEQPVRVGKVSITDNHSLYQFTVAMEDLTEKDMGLYNCGVTVKRGHDLVASINVTAASQTPKQSTDVSPKLAFSSTRYLLYISFLSSIGLKTVIFLVMVTAIIWTRHTKGPGFSSASNSL